MLREHFSAVIAQSVRVSSIIFFGSSNAVRNLRNQFPTRPRQPTSKAKKRTVNPFSAIRFAKSWYFLVFVSCQYVMRASIGQESSPKMMSLVDSLMRTMSGLSFFAVSVGSRADSCRGRPSVDIVLISFECSNAFSLVVCKTLSCLHAIRLNELSVFPRATSQCPRMRPRVLFSFLQRVQMSSITCFPER